MLNLGIIGPGKIAQRMADTVRRMDAAVGIVPYAVASRDGSRAREFAERWGFAKAYEGYDAMIADPDVNLIYIATPHSEHYANARACLDAGKHVLCEKAFTMNADQAEALIQLARTRNVFLAEAMWTRYMPSRRMIADILQSGIIGTPMTIAANLCYPIADKERVIRPELGGGALLDIGVYPLNFALTYFGADVERIVSACTKTLTGVDAQETITLFYRDGRMASLYVSMLVRSNRQGVISGDKGHVIVHNINNPERITVVNNDYTPVAEHCVPPQITGFEYQLMAAKEAIERGDIETPFMPHCETIRIMRIADQLRKEWGVTI